MNPKHHHRDPELVYPNCYVGGWLGWVSFVGGLVMIAAIVGGLVKCIGGG